jgi:hypothetical protein
MLGYGIALVRYARVRARAARAAGPADLGASALEWAIIAAIVVVAASIIGAVVMQLVRDKSTQLQDCANQPLGSECGTGG